VKPKPVAGYDIELISVLVDYREEAKRMPNQLKIRFYLERHSEVYLTVPSWTIDTIFGWIESGLRGLGSPDLRIFFNGQPRT
jgi:hypothetical protein